MDRELVAPELVAAFRRDGFVVVPELLSKQELEHYGPLVDAGVEKRRFGDPRALAQKSRYEQCFTQCMNLWEDCPGVRPLTFHQKLGGAAAQLLGVPRLRVWHDQALYKEADGIATDPHQDHPYWPIAETTNITAWIPFDGSTLASGAMGYVPGSHRFGVKKFVMIFGKEKPYDIVQGPESRGVEPVFVEVPPGAVAFHHGLTIHLAKPNTSGRARRVHTIIYFSDGSTRGPDFPHFSVDRFGIPVGGVIDSPATPVVYPRADGDLPAPPDDAPFFLRPYKIPRV